MLRKAFTLIELLVIIGIMASMVTVGVVSMSASRGATRVFGAGRDTIAMVRLARAIALITQQEVVVVFANGKEDDEACAQVEIRAKRLFADSDRAPEKVWTLNGDLVSDDGSAGDNDLKTSAQSDDETVENDGEGRSVEDVLAPERLPPDVMKGLKLQVVEENEQLAFIPENETRRSKISIFSTADNISRTLTSERPEAIPKVKPKDDAEEENAEPVMIAFHPNGTVTPACRIYLYGQDSTPDKGICISIDRFGDPKIEEDD